MIAVTPKVFFLAEPAIHYGSAADPGLTAWLDHIGGAEALACLKHVEGEDIEQIIEFMARRCYKSFAPGLNPNVSKIRTDSAAYHANIAKQRHGSVVAHGMVTYAFEDVSRVFTHEIVRNSIGTERSQESLRYVRLTNLRFWIPPIIAKEMELRAVDSLRDTLSNEKEISKISATPVDIFEAMIKVSEWGQRALAQYYDIENIKDFELKKKLTSAFRRVAPIGLATGIGISFNLRALRWIIEQRTHRSAEEEMRLVFGIIAEDALKRWPMMFQDFKKVDTGDGLFEYVPEFSKI